jgi:NAD(P)-dependent dehydrogenase (short-subunit alcohol dehydrogenase family)
MFNNAGISGARHPHLLDDDLADFHKVTSVNLLGVMAGTREAARHMSTDGGGSIINMSSIGGIQAAPGMWSYHTSKVGVIFFTKCAALDLGEHGIRVNCIAPGNIETPILGSVMAAGLAEDEKAELMKRVREFIISRQAIKRQGTTGDIAEAALYLASDRSSYVTGTLLAVDGGMTAGSPPETAKSFEATKQGGAKR